MMTKTESIPTMETDPVMRFHVFIGGDDEMYVTRKASQLKPHLANLQEGHGSLDPEGEAHWMREA